jgi:DNA-binding FrmR family transcriptional regulator
MADSQRRIARLKTIAGHLRGVQRMVTADAYCIDIIRQTKAIQRAVDTFNSLVLAHHLEHCITAIVRSEDERERERVMTELLAVFAPLREGEEPPGRGDIPHLAHLQAIEEDVRAVQRLAEADAYCIDIITRAQAVKHALDDFNIRILADHLNGCVTTAIRGNEVAERERKLRELVQVFDTTSGL